MRYGGSGVIFGGLDLRSVSGQRDHRRGDVAAVAPRVNDARVLKRSLAVPIVGGLKLNGCSTGET